MPFLAAALALVACTQGLAAGPRSASQAPGSASGRALYRQGVLPSGAPLVGTREGNAALTGADAACISCHRRSGLGMTEGLVTIPPIAGPYLFRPQGRRIDDEAVPYVGTSRLAHRAYTDESLARAIRTGVAPDGRALSYLMPRYLLDDASMGDLIAYLKDLIPRHVPGVTDSVLHFATIVTPDADPARRDGTLEVLQKYFIDKNTATRMISPRMYPTRPTMFMVHRKWQLHVWELQGDPESWEQQLRERLHAEPVFAVISGVGGRNWEPIHRFCESESLPCLFPNVEVPAGDDGDFYSLYFSRQVLLEAQLIARQLHDFQGSPPLHRVVQVFRDDDVGVAAAAALRELSRDAPVTIEDRVLRGGGATALARALRQIDATDAVVLWLRPADLEALPRPPAPLPVAWMSGLMGGLDSAPLPGSWRTRTRMTYPVDLPEKRLVRVDYALGWFSIRHIPIVALQAQADAYLACGLLSETLNHMVETFERDYLIERIEAELDHRVLTGYYPRLTLAAGQRFASKGGYVVRFASPDGPKLEPVSDWITP
jgi:hypothetical protein